MNGVAFSVAFIVIVIGLSVTVIVAAEEIIPAWYRRWSRNRARRLARRQDVIDMARWRAVRRIGGQS